MTSDTDYLADLAAGLDDSGSAMPIERLDNVLRQAHRRLREIGYPPAARTPLDTALAWLSIAAQRAGLAGTPGEAKKLTIPALSDTTDLAEIREPLGLARDALAQLVHALRVE